MSRSFFEGLLRAARWAPPLLLFFLAGAAPAEEFYYLLLFGSQQTPTSADHAHTFATFLRAYGDGPRPTAFVVEDCFTISWLPATAEVHTRARTPETGHNFTLPATLAILAGEKERVSMWGPYRIDEQLYSSAQRRCALLQSGAVRYKACDSGYPLDRVTNCIHAVGAAVEGDRPRDLMPLWGEPASWVVLQRFGPFIMDTKQTHDWVCSYLGLDNYPLIRRDYDRDPRTGPVWSAVKTAFGVEP